MKVEKDAVHVNIFESTSLCHW